MANFAWNFGGTISELFEKIRHVEVLDDEDLVQAAMMGRSVGFHAADAVDTLCDAVEDALEDYDKVKRSRFGTARSRAVVRSGRIYAGGLRQADRVFRHIVTTYEKKYQEEISAARRKDSKPNFTPGGKH